MSTAVEGENADSTSSSSSTSQNISGARNGARAPTRKRNRSVVISDKYNQMVEYEAAPAEFQSWIDSASTTLTLYGSEAGRRTADFNITRVIRSRVQSNDIGIAAVEEPDENEVFDMDFLASSNLLFFEFLGSPGALAYVRCLGCLSDRDEGVDRVGPKSTHQLTFCWRKGTSRRWQRR